MPITVTLGKLNSLTYNMAQCVSNSTSCHLQCDVNSFSVLPVRAAIAVSGADLLIFSLQRVKAVVNQGEGNCGAHCHRRLLWLFNKFSKGDRSFLLITGVFKIKLRLINLS